MDAENGIKQLWFAWIILGILFMVADYLVLTPVSKGFYTGVIYAVSCFTVASLIYCVQAKKINIYGVTIGVILGALPVITYALAFNIAKISSWLIIVAIIGFIASTGLNWAKPSETESPSIKYLAALPMLMWIFWGVAYLYSFTPAESTAVLSFPTLMYHIGIMLFSGYSLLRYAGKSNPAYDTKLTVLFLTIAAAGMLLFGYSEVSALSVWI